MKTPLTKEKILQMSLEELKSISPEENPASSKIFPYRKKDFICLRSGFIAILDGAFIKKFSFKKIAECGGEIFSKMTF